MKMEEMETLGITTNLHNTLQEEELVLQEEHLLIADMEQMDRNLIYAGRTLGMSERRIFWTVMIPSCRKGILAGTVLAMARAIGEFGATMMVAGNIPGHTQTLSTAVYTAMQAGDRTSAFRWVLVILALSLPMMFFINYFGNGKKGG